MNQRVAGQTRTQWLLRCLLAPLQRFENAAIQVLLGYNPDTAVGVQLDVLGKIVGQPRLGLADNVYRRYIKARIATNRSSGKREELIKIARLVLGDDVGQIIIRGRGWDPGASFILEVQDRVTTDDEGEALLYFLGDAVVAGVRVIVEWSTVPLAATFRLDVGPGLDVGVLAESGDNATS